ncbi:MAG: EamA family transporter [Gammaproteobacteria bacterium]|nr:EamA family transporter [Gammaproteobacteria bacterium]
MSNLQLYALATLIWGSTWLAITFQLGTVAPEVSVVYRFSLAGLLMLAFCAFRGMRLAYSLKDHAWIALLGLSYGLNYAFVYHAEAHISSGLVAVACSSMLFMNIALALICFGTRPSREMLAGAALGVAGIVLVFWPELRAFAASGESPWILSWPILAALGASVANMIATRNGHAGLPVLPVNALWMLWCAAAVAVYALSQGKAFSFEWTPGYVLSLTYLAVFGSIIAFGAYLTLLGRIGSSKASYMAVLTPILALMLSTLFEGFEWHASTYVGVALGLAGNLLIVRKKAPKLELPLEPLAQKQAA